MILTVTILGSASFIPDLATLYIKIFIKTFGESLKYRVEMLGTRSLNFSDTYHDIHQEMHHQDTYLRNIVSSVDRISRW